MQILKDYLDYLYLDAAQPCRSDSLIKHHLCFVGICGVLLSSKKLDDKVLYLESERKKWDP